MCQIRFYSEEVTDLKKIQVIISAIMLPALLLLAGCSAGAQGAEPSAASEPAAATVLYAAPASSESGIREPAPQAPGTTERTRPDEIWTEEEMPVSVRYDRLWVYSTYGETEDPELIKELVEAVQALEINGESEWYTEDHTDILTFTFADGRKLRLEFENQSWVRTDNERYEVSGLDAVREILEMILPDT